MHLFARRSQGFTLLEILLVISMIALFMGIFVINLSPRDQRRDLRGEALLFESLVRLLVDEAIFKHKEIGLKIYHDKVAILVFNPSSQTWEASVSKKNSSKKSNSSSNEFQDYRIPDFVELSLEMEDVELFLNPQKDELESKIASINPLANYDELNLDETEQEEKIEPDIYIFSSGEITAFELEFRLMESAGDFVYVISANDIGAVSCKALHERDEKC